VLGDDVVIHNRKVALRYERILAMIGVEINRTKSVIADGNTRRSEFSKRNFVDGDEITGLKADILTIAGSSLLMIPDLLRVSTQRS